MCNRLNFPLNEDTFNSFLFSLTKNPEREKFYHFSDPISTVKDVFFKLKENNISWETMEDLKNYRIAISKGYAYSPVFMDAVNSGLLENIYSMSGESLELRQLQMLKSDRLDLTICEASVCQYIIQSNAPELDMIDFIDRPIGNIRTYHIGFSKKWPGNEELVKMFNEELKTFIAEGKRELIFKKYEANISFDQ